MRPRIKLYIIPIVFVTVLIISTFMFIPSKVVEYEETVSLDEISEQYSYEFTEADLQLPELPTGCEATALSTLLRINGVDVTKTEVADAMPKSDTDFVNAFQGDPYSDTGGCCLAPCLMETAQLFLLDVDLNAYIAEGEALDDLPLPCVVWVTIGLEEPIEIAEQDGYIQVYPSHAMTVMEIREYTVVVIDPLEGVIEYDRESFEQIYEACSSQAVYIK